jgi:hypothetical protein
MHYRANDLMAAEAEVSREKIGGKAGEAQSMLYGLLGDGPKAARVIEEEAGRRELSWRTVEASKATLGVESKNVGGAWVWALPDDRLPL